MNQPVHTEFKPNHETVQPKTTPPIESEPNEPIQLETYSEPTNDFGSPRFGKVFSRRKATIPILEHVHDFESTPKNEVQLQSTFSSLPSDEPRDTLTSPPITIRKGTREYTRRPLYPISKYVSFEKFASAHKSFLVSLNSITFPQTLSDALSNENWKQAMSVEMQALEKNKTWELVEYFRNKP